MQPRAPRREVGWAVLLGLRDVGKPADFPPTEGLCSGIYGAMVGGNYRNDDFCWKSTFWTGLLVFFVP